MKNSNILTIGALLVSSALVMQPKIAMADGNIGFVELQFGLGQSVNDEDDEKSSDNFQNLSGSYLYQLNNGISLIFNGEYRTDNHGDSDIIDNDDMEFQANLSLHALYNLNERTKLGAFAGYSKSTHDEDDKEYGTSYGGLEAHYAAAENTTFFVQAGLGTNNTGNQSSSGFEDGRFARLGAFHILNNNAVVSADFEMANSREYEDSSEPGSFASLSAKYEKDLAVLDNTTFSLGLRHGTFKALSDDDSISETTAFIGLRYNFGGSTAASQKKAGIIGDPYLPIRAGSWVPALD